MKYSFRRSNRKKHTTEKNRKYRLAAYNCPKIKKQTALEQIPLIDFSDFFKIPDTPLLTPPRKKKRVTLSKIRSSLSLFFAKLTAAISKRIQSKKPKSSAMIGGLICAALTVSLLSGTLVLLPFVIKYTRSYETITVPDFTDLTYGDILAIDDERFSFVINQTENISAKAGEVITQAPKPNASRRLYGKNDKLTVTLTVCAEKESFTIDDPVSKKARDIILHLRNKGVSVKVDEKYSDTIPKGTVISSSYTEGTPLNSESQITLTVSLGKRIIYTSVPNLIGMSEADARELLTKLGFSVGQISYSESELSAGSVTAQGTMPYTSLPLGSEITFTVSTGTSRIKKVPKLYGMTLEEARAKLRECGLVLGEVFYIEGNENNATVVDQTPVADTPISSSVVAVDIFIGK